MPSAARPMHLRAGPIALVAGGGAVGTAAREAVVLAVPSAGGFPVAILAVNLAGAFLLGLLLESLLRRGPDAGGRRTLRLLLGTGFCGGFTTYSSLATATAVLLAAGSTVIAVGYALTTVLLGAVATWAGVAAGAAGAGRQRR